MKKKIEKMEELTVQVPKNGILAKSANIVRVTTTGNNEVILDFVFTHPQEIDGDVQIGNLISRVVLPKKVAKDLSEILIKHLKK